MTTEQGTHQALATPEPVQAEVERLKADAARACVIGLETIEVTLPPPGPRCAYEPYCPRKGMKDADP